MKKEETRRMEYVSGKFKILKEYSSKDEFSVVKRSHRWADYMHLEIDEIDILCELLMEFKKDLGR